MEECVMKKLSAVALLCVLAACDTAPRQPATAYAQPRDPAQWRVVSVTPVPAGTAARVAAASPTGKAEEFSSTPVASMPPAYGAAPVYGPVPGPVYVQEPAYYWPPVSLSLGFVFGRHWSSGYRHRGYRHR
jgi:hypothetical protein